MAGFTTHYILGIKSYHAMPDNQLKNIISGYSVLYRLGLQGPDMFFYNLPILRHRDYRNVGSYMHEAHSNGFFANAFEMINMLEDISDKHRAISYIAGFISHYIGDYITHPFIYGRIGHNPDAPNNYTHGLHAELENDIDAILLKKYKGIKPSEFSQADTIILNKQDTTFISDFLAGIINKTYYPINYKNNFTVSKGMVARSITAMRFGCRTLSDPSGRKRKSINFIENIFLKSPIVSNRIIYDEVKDTVKSLNLKHEIWTNPWNRSLSSKKSFPELFKLCLIKCDEAYRLFDSHIYENSDYHRLLSALGNFSYHSGLPLKEY